MWTTCEQQHIYQADSQTADDTTHGQPAKMTSPTTTIAQKFLSRPQELGVVAVGFSDGQVGPQLPPPPGIIHNPVSESWD